MRGIVFILSRLNKKKRPKERFQIISWELYFPHPHFNRTGTALQHSKAIHTNDLAHRSWSVLFRSRQLGSPLDFWNLNFISVNFFANFTLSYKKDFAPLNLKWTFWRHSRESWLPFAEQTIIVYMPLKMTDPVTIIAQSTQCRASRPILAHSKTFKHWGDRIMTWWSPMAFHRRVIVSVAFVG